MSAPASIIPATTKRADFVRALVQRIHDTPHGEAVDVPPTVNVAPEVRADWTREAQRINKETAMRNRAIVDAYLALPVCCPPTNTEQAAWETERSRGMSQAEWERSHPSTSTPQAMRLEWEVRHP